MSRILALAAYGRSYNTPEACADDWNTGKDFKICNGPYFSIRDKDTMIKDGITTIVVLTGIGRRLLTINLADTDAD